MDHENYPVALPSGQIYSISGLKSTSINNKFYCMITETWYDKEEAIKIYLTWKINDTCWINYGKIEIMKFWLSYLDVAGSLAWKALEDYVLYSCFLDFLFQLGFLEVVVLNHLFDELLGMRCFHKADSASSPPCAS